MSNSVHRLLGICHHPHVRQPAQVALISHPPRWSDVHLLPCRNFCTSWRQIPANAQLQPHQQYQTWPQPHTQLSSLPPHPVWVVASKVLTMPAVCQTYRSIQAGPQLRIGAPFAACDQAALIVCWTAWTDSCCMLCTVRMHQCSAT